MSKKTVCAECNNSGWIIFKNEAGYTVAKPCKCEAGVRSTLKRIGIPEKYLDCSFDNFQVVVQGKENHRLKGARRILKDFVDGFELRMLRFKSSGQAANNQEVSFLIKGTVGSGKTHLCAAVARGLVQKGFYDIYFIDFKELLDEIKSTFSYSSETSEAEVLYPILNAGLLIIDDLGSERNTEWTEDVFARILNYRYNRNLPVIITTNYFDRQVKGALTDETLEERIGTRMRSRLYEICKDIEIVAPDYRISKHKR